MRILLITETLIRDDNNVGNSYSNIFSDMNDICLANVCCQQGQSQTAITDRCYQISEKLILKSIFDNSMVAGHVEDKSKSQSDVVINKRERKIYNLARILRFQIFFWIRNCIWKTGKWKENELCQFVDEFKPDLIFAQLQDRLYLNDVIIFLKNHLKKPLVVYTWDDVYSLKQFSLSPFYWIDRFLQRRKIRKVIALSSKIYTISYEQSKEYEAIFKKNCSILYKGYNFDDSFDIKEIGDPIKIVYTGNLYGGRWRTVALLCRSLKRININGIRMQLFIYSATPLLKCQIKQLSVEGITFFCGDVTAKKVSEVQKTADILLHVEAFSLKERLTTRLSFSTKLVDYFAQQKCILAIGHPGCSSMKYLRRNDAAIIIENEDDVLRVLSYVLANRNIIQSYAKKSWQCGVSNHQINKIRGTLQADLIEIARNNTHS